MRAARRLAAEVLRDSRYSGDVETVLLLVSELVTNAVRHAATDFELHLRVDRQQVTVTVLDHDRAHPPRLRHPGPTDTNGRGLQIVDRLASSWGSEPVGTDGKQVWFRCHGGAAAAAVVSGDAGRVSPSARALRAARRSARQTRR